MELKATRTFGDNDVEEERLATKTSRYIFSRFGPFLNVIITKCSYS